MIHSSNLTNQKTDKMSELDSSNLTNQYSDAISMVDSLNLTNWKPDATLEVNSSNLTNQNSEEMLEVDPSNLTNQNTDEMLEVDFSNLTNQNSDAMSVIDPSNLTNQNSDGMSEEDPSNLTNQNSDRMSEVDSSILTNQNSDVMSALGSSNLANQNSDVTSEVDSSNLANQTSDVMSEVDSSNLANENSVVMSVVDNSNATIFIKIEPITDDEGESEQIAFKTEPEEDDTDLPFNLNTIYPMANTDEDNPNNNHKMFEKSEEGQEDEYGVNYNGVKYYDTTLNLEIKRCRKEQIGAFRFECRICKKLYLKKVQMDICMMNHKGLKPHKCEQCGRGFTEQSKLRRHYLTHSQEKPHKCHLCNKQFSLAYNLKIHLRRHTGFKPFSCHLCGKSFSQLGNRNQHILKHNQHKHGKIDRKLPSKNNNVPCQYCEEKFTSEYFLDEHMQYFHCVQKNRLSSLGDMGSRWEPDGRDKFFDDGNETTMFLDVQDPGSSTKNEIPEDLTLVPSAIPDRSSDGILQDPDETKDKLFKVPDESDNKLTEKDRHELLQLFYKAQALTDQYDSDGNIRDESIDSDENIHDESIDTDENIKNESIDTHENTAGKVSPTQRMKKPRGRSRKDSIEIKSNGQVKKVRPGKISSTQTLKKVNVDAKKCSSGCCSIMLDGSTAFGSQWENFYCLYCTKTKKFNAAMKYYHHVKENHRGLQIKVTVACIFCNYVFHGVDSLSLLEAWFIHECSRLGQHDRAEYAGLYVISGCVNPEICDSKIEDDYVDDNVVSKRCRRRRKLVTSGMNYSESLTSREPASMHSELQEQSEKPYPCTNCSLAFARQSSLKSHVKMFHSGYTKLI